ncbi:putative late blight resistance protein homolog R1B-16 [Salvia splendens]|uniref:putative late blight resistance protein homolog R1B-16 n=1 Tax=Salvia splendens TaxID=180675 RepID=UPI001C258C37|nr:putative late blight resistance protein homolog R1B-16 [Salvia splendens]
MPLTLHLPIVIHQRHGFDLERSDGGIVALKDERWASASSDLHGSLQKVIEEMDLIEKEVVALKDEQVSSSSAGSVTFSKESSLPRLNNSTMVGFDDVMLRLMEKHGRQVIPIVGMGGIANKQRLSEMSEDEIRLSLHKCLSHRRYVIVLDDMWSIEAWEKLQRYFPDNSNGSRIMVTTRLSNLGSQLNNNYSLKMKFMNVESSWITFCKTVFI